MTQHVRTRSTRMMIALLMAALLAMAAGCAADSPAVEPAEPAEQETADSGGTSQEHPTEQASDTLTDGSIPAYLTDVGQSTVVVDKIEILSGDEAVAARAEDGEPPVEEGLDIPYLRNRNDKLRSLPVASDVAVAVYDCSQACEHVGWDYADLVAGTPLPYGSMDVPFMVTVRDGQVVELAEVYLP